MRYQFNNILLMIYNIRENPNSLLLVIFRPQQILQSEIPPLERNTQCVPYKRVSQYSLFSYGLNVRIYQLSKRRAMAIFQ